MSKFTPMMQQYFDIKNKYKDAILFYRLGDFYEMFFEDALTASRELEITLTGRDCGQEDRAPMCGVPFHAADAYIAKLVNKGYKVAIAEQIEDPALAKGIVKRDVIKIVTPGTVTDVNLLDEKKNNFIMSIYKVGNCFGIAVMDITTGDFKCSSITWGNTKSKLLDEIAKFSPSEICCNKAFSDDVSTTNLIKSKFDVYLSNADETYFASINAVKKINEYCSVEETILKDMPSANAAGALLSYAEETQKSSLNHISDLMVYSIDEYMAIDVSSRRNLELTETIRDKKKKGSLLGVIDKTKTAMGGRKIKSWVEQPLINCADIDFRLAGVEQLKDKFMVRSEIRELLRGVFDLERLASKISLGSANCRDLLALKNSISMLAPIKNLLEECTNGLNGEIYASIDLLEDVHALIENSIDEDAPITIKEGNIIKLGYNDAIDSLKNAAVNGRTWLAELEVKEREKTNIKNLKVSYNRVFGYYFEVTKSYYDLIPEYFIRKQTLANAERFITEELKELEDKLLSAQNNLVAMEYEAFVEIRQYVFNQIGRIKTTANAIANLDATCSLAEVAERENYCRPTVNEGEKIDVRGGRHPVVESILSEVQFIPNDSLLDLNEDRLSIITGPNMAGKSTYMRQIAIIVILAQIGSFVPADYAEIGIVDKVFTRIGASDDLASGQSTFMVEMNEMANILLNATKRSLLILDEIGRGTSTYDGLSIAWAVLEYIVDSNRLGCRTLFATHYHELTELEGKILGVKNYCMSVKKNGDDIVFLRKIIRGGADGSYGVEVASLAGLPTAVVTRAKEILIELETADIAKIKRKSKASSRLDEQYDLFNFLAAEKGNNEIIEMIENLDLTNITPIQAMQKLFELQQKLKG